VTETNVFPLSQPGTWIGCREKEAIAARERAVFGIVTITVRAIRHPIAGDGP